MQGPPLSERGKLEYPPELADLGDCDGIHRPQGDGEAAERGWMTSGGSILVGGRIDPLIGRQGEIRDRSSEGQYYRMAGLSLLAAIVIYWNTAHLGEAVRQRKHAGLTVEPELLAHILLTGEYRWPKRR